MEQGSDLETLYSFKSSLKIGELERYVVTFNLYEGEELPEDVVLDSLWVEIKNIESLSYRAAYLMGPFGLYCDLKTSAYHHSQKIISTLDRPQFDPNLQPQQTFKAELSLHEIKKKYVWVIDIISQIVFSTVAQTSFEITIKRRNSSKFGCGVSRTNTVDLVVSRLTTLDIWNLNSQTDTGKDKNKHLVVLTHGLHSNVTADMVYTMEQICKTQKKSDSEQLVVRGYTGNVCETEKGVKYLGTKLAKYIVEELYDEKVTKISLIGHSLGGLIQTFAIAYITVKYPWFFDKVEPINFITMASPLLGIVTDNPAYVKMLLSFGVIGKTGQDLNLDKENENDYPLLLKLPGDPVKKILQKFTNRTIYANAVNDGIVPLYTAGLLFLDYDDILTQLKKLSDYRNIKESPEMQNILAEEQLELQNFNANKQDNIELLKKTFVSPLTKMLNIWTPQSYLVAKNSKIPRISLIESATSVLLPPLPETSYITDPDQREPVILHDKIYTENDLPDKSSDIQDTLLESENILTKAFTMSRGGEKSKEQKLEELIARKWHEGLSWRKVVVALKPDAHNNIIVRRRFSNAHGWLVIDHLIENHFTSPKIVNKVQTLENPIIETQQDIKSLSVEPNRKFSWITKVDTSSVFDEGPTGMISTVGEMFDTFTKKQMQAINRRVSESSTQEKNSLDQYSSEFLV